MPTNKRKIEQKFENSEVKWRTYLENAPQNIAVLDREGKLLFVNRRHFGKIEDAIGTHFSDYLTPEIQEIAKKYFDLVFEQGETNKFEIYLIDPSGNKVWFEINVSPIKEGEEIVSALYFYSDITARKKSEITLKEAHDIINSTPAVAFLWKNEEGWPVEYVSDNVKDTFGYIPEDFYSKEIVFASIIYPEDLERISNEVDYYSTDPMRTSFTQEYRILTKEGINKWITDKTTIRRNKEGNITHYQGIVLDITERKEAENNLQIYNNKLEILRGIIIIGNNAMNLTELLEKILDLVLKQMKFEGGGIYLANEEEKKIELMHHKGLPLDFVEKVKRVSYEVNPRDIVMIKGLPLFTDNFQSIDPENSKKWGFLSLASIPLFNKEKVIGALNITSKRFYNFSNEEKDVLQAIGREVGTTIIKMQVEQKLRDSEEKYRNIFEKSSNSIVLLDITGRIIECNSSTEKIFGYTNEELVGRNYLTLPFYSESMTNILKERFKSIKEQINIKPQELEIKRKDGSKAIVYSNISYIRVGDQKFVQAIIQDITEQKQAEQRLKDSEEKYREAYNLSNFYKDLFTHDINNILQGIISTSEYYRLFRDDPDKMKNLGDISQVIINHAKRGSLLVSNVRKLSKLDEMEMSFKSIEVMTTLNKAINNIKNGFQERDVKVNINGLLEDLMVLGNDLLMDVFENLLNNAVKFTIEKEKVDVEIFISRILEDEASYLKFEFNDYGIGIPDKNKVLLFHRQSTETFNEKGMGMGLSLVKKIVDKYGGRICVEDRVNGDYKKGSKFVLMLKEL